MDRVFEKDPRFRHLEKKVGIFVVLTVAGLLAVIAFIGREKDLFSNKYTIFFKVDSGSGLSEGMTVKLSGFRIGRIKNLSLDEKARVRVAVEINKKYQKWIRSGSAARLIKEGVIGESVIEITVGRPESPVLSEKQEIPFEKVGGVEELAQDIKPVFQELKAVLAYINNPEGDIKKTLRNLSRLTAEARETRARLDAVIVEVNHTVKEATGTISVLKATAEKAAPVVDNAGMMMDKIDRKLGPVLDNMTNTASDMEKSLQKLPQIAGKVDGILTETEKMTGLLVSEGPRIKDMMGTSESLLRDSSETLKGIKDSWPVNRMVPKKEEFRLVPLDGAGKGK